MAGTTFTWTATTASAWTTASNWSPAGIPAAGDTAVVPAGSVLVHTGTVAAADLSLGGSLTTPQPGKGTISATATAEILVSDALAVWSGSTLSVDPTSSIDIGTSGSVVAGDVVIDNGHSLAGSGLISASVVNNGTIDVLGSVASNVFTPGTLEITGSVGGTGAIALVGPDSIVQLDDSVSTGQTISFGTGSELILSTPGTGLAVPIRNLNTGDKIEFAGLRVTSASVTSPGTITVVTTSGTYQLTDVTFAAGANQQFATGTDPTNGAGYIQVLPGFANWIGGSGNLGTSSNWQGGVAPSPTLVADFVNNPGTLTGTANVLSLEIGRFNSVNTGIWTFNGTTITAAGQHSPPQGLPFAAGFNMNTVLNGGTLNAAGDTSIGSPGGATVTAEGGVHVTTLGDGVGPSAGQSGSLVLTGIGTTWTEQSGAPVNGNVPGFLNFGFFGPANGLAGGAGFLTVTNNATLNTGGLAIFGGLAGGHGEGTISTGGIWNAQGILIGSGGTGTLAINGGTITTAGFSDIGSSTSGSGTVTLASGGLWNAQQLAVGDSGSGTLAVNGGTIVTAAPLTVGANGGAVGTATIGNGGIIKANGTFDAVGNNAGSDGSLIINSGGQFQVSGTNFVVGNNAGSTGSLVINAGGTLHFTGTSVAATVLNIGHNAATSSEPGGTGTALVTGAGALLNTNGSPLEVGRSGLGSLTVAQGGSVAVGTPDSNVVYGLGVAYSGGTGSITVTDPGSTFTLDGFGFDGRGGSGVVTVRNSGSFVVNDAPANGGGFNIGVGRGAGPSAPGNVGGEGAANITTGGVLDINSKTSGIGVGGNGADGVLNVSNGGTVLAGTGLSVGTATSAGGTIYGGTGALNIGAGGLLRVSNPTLTGYDITVGNANSSIGGITNAASGEALVSGAGALLDGNGGGLAVGLFSDGGLVISQGGSVITGTPNNSTFSALSVGRGANGSITITDPGSSETANGSAYVGRAGTGNLTVQNHGSLTVGVDGLGNGGLSIGGAGLANGSTLYVGGNGTGLVATNGEIFSQQNVDVGRNGTDGALTIDAGGTVEAGQQVVLGSSITLTAGDTIINTAGTTAVTAPTVESATGNIDVGPGGLLKADGTGLPAGTAAMVIGSGSGSTGDLNVSGTGALVSDTGGLTVGSAGTGELSIGPGGTVMATTVDAGVQSGAAGIITLSGSGADLTTTGTASIGDAGSGELSILNGASANVGGDLNIGQIAGDSGNVDVEGSSTLVIGANLNLGAGGPGELTVGPNATVMLDNGGISGGPNAILNLFNTIDPLFQNGGTLNIHNSGTQNFPAYVNNAIFNLSTSVHYTLNTPDIQGTSAFNIGASNSELVLNADSLSSTSTVSFSDKTGTLDVGIDNLATIEVPNSGTGPFSPLPNPNLGLPLIGGFDGTINNFASGDVIIVDTTAAATFSQSGSDISVMTGGLTLGTLAFATVAEATIAATTPGALVDQVIPPPCFVAGTRISTERGEVAVESLRIGDRVQVIGTVRSSYPIIWIGKRTVDCGRHPHPGQVRPVRISAGAFGPSKPARDLSLSPNHAVYVGDVLIPVKYLVNGSTIAEAPVDDVTYYHVELAQHAVLLAEGLPAESYLDTGDRSNFANGNGPIALYPDFASRVWDAEGCAPLVVTGPALEAARRWVNGLAGRVAQAA
jgi:T5SS/PEP-CTERM-associated repeat protein